MAKFLKNVAPFKGDGSRNEMGQSLEEFLEDYDPRRYETPSVTADILVFIVPEGRTSVEFGLKLLLIKRRNHPGIGMWALPGGFAEMRENLIDSAARELKEETNLEGIPLEQLCAWGDYDRDPRTRLITVSHMAVLREADISMQAGDDAADAMWADVILEKTGESILSGESTEKKQTRYELTLTNQEGRVLASASVSCVENRGGLLKCENYQVTDQTDIAFDHPCMIVQALRLLEGRMGQ